jgi:hypothetical protein
MNESDKIRSSIVNSKLEKLIQQFKLILTDDFPYGDSKAAAGLLKLRAEKLRKQAEDFGRFSSATQKQFGFKVNYVLESFSHISGMITRSGTMRNAFELYSPFKKICQAFFEEKIQLVLSSEWNYIPFTYPMNLQELPDLIIIGLPSSESNNVLIFPSAAHELGHSIWLKEELTERYSNGVYTAVEKELRRNPTIMDFLSPGIGGKDFNETLFSKQMIEEFLSGAVESCHRQMEELFCDFIAIKLFGKSYLLAFQYLVAPGDASLRSVQYPDTKARVIIMERVIVESGGMLTGFANEFVEDRHHAAHSYHAFLLRVADAVRSAYVDELLKIAAEFVSRAGLAGVSEENVSRALKNFESGIPFDGEASLGDLITAAWDVFLNDKVVTKGSGSHHKISYISDLVLKSAEAQEFKRSMQDA